MPYIRANGIRIAFDTFGCLRNKPLFLIHGLTGQRMSMEKLAEQLSDEFFVITYDCRGHGQTDHPSAYDLADHGRDLLALIDVLGYEQASVLGASMGSYIALQAAELDPAKIDKLILVTAKSYDDGSGSSVQRLLREEGLDMATAPPEEKSRVLSTALWALVGFDLRKDLEKVSCKTLVVSGTYDRINPPGFGREIAEKIPQAEYTEFPGGHLLTMEFEEEYVRCVRAFLEK